MPSILDILMLGLAVSSSAYIIRHTSGPFDVFTKLREHLGFAEYDITDAEGNVVGTGEYVPERFMPKLVDCMWCLSTWLAVIFMILHEYLPFFVQWFAIVAVSCTLLTYVKSHED